LNVANININLVYESGLLGLIINHNFIINNYIYLYYTYDKIRINRILQFIINKILLNNETIILNNIPNKYIYIVVA